MTAGSAGRERGWPVFLPAHYRGGAGASAPGGYLIFEIGYDQAEDVSALMRDAGFTEVRVKKTWQGLTGSYMEDIVR